MCKVCKVYKVCKVCKCVNLTSKSVPEISNESPTEFIDPAEAAKS